MRAVTICFTAHNPFVLRTDFNFFSIGNGGDYFDRARTLHMLNTLCDSCYKPALEAVRAAAQEFPGRVVFGLDISAALVHQLRQHRPDVLASFADLASRGALELLGGTGYRSLASLVDADEFEAQAQLHDALLAAHFGAKPAVFANTELVYANRVCDAVAKARRYTGIIAEGAKSLLGWRSPNFAYLPTGSFKVKLLFRNSELSDALTFRFAGGPASESFAAPFTAPLTAPRYADMLRDSLREGEALTLMTDLETFGYYQPQRTGIISFLRHLPAAVLERGMEFCSARETVRRARPVAKIDAPNATSWAGDAKDTTAWMGSELQRSALDALYGLRHRALESGDAGLIALWRTLHAAEYFEYMDTRWQNENFTPHCVRYFQSPEQAYIIYMNILNDLAVRLERAAAAKRPVSRTISASSSDGTTQ